MIKNISKHLTYKEATKSNTAKRLGIDNAPNSIQLSNLIEVATRIFEPLREAFSTPIGITSGFRSKALNDAINGSETSHHCTGQALDIDADIYGNVTNRQIFEYIKTYLDFDQVISEFEDETGEPSWVHVSYISPSKNRNQILKAYKDGKRTKYIEV